MDSRLSFFVSCVMAYFRSEQRRLAEVPFRFLRGSEFLSACSVYGLLGCQHRLLGPDGAIVAEQSQADLASWLTQYQREVITLRKTTRLALSTTHCQKAELVLVQKSETSAKKEVHGPQICGVC